MEACEAILNHVRFHREDSGFTIGVFQQKKETFAGLGTIIKPQVGITYQLYGKWVNDEKWGRQFQFRNYEAKIPKSTDGIYRYIVHMSKWVGPKIGAQLIGKYGEDTLDILRDNPGRVANEIKGITLERAQEIQTFMIRNQAKEAALVTLEGMIGGIGLRKSLPMELLSKWGSDAPDILKENPYVLMDIKRIGFPTADMVATTRFNIDQSSLPRQVGSLRHLLRENESQGNIWIEESELLQKAKGLIGVPAEEGFAQLLGNTAVRDGDHVALLSSAADEDFIAQKIVSLLMLYKEQEGKLEIKRPKRVVNMGA